MTKSSPRFWLSANEIVEWYQIHENLPLEEARNCMFDLLEKELNEASDWEDIKIFLIKVLPLLRPGK